MQCTGNQIRKGQMLSWHTSVMCGHISSLSPTPFLLCFIFMDGLASTSFSRAHRSCLLQRNLYSSLCDVDYYKFWSCYVPNFSTELGWYELVLCPVVLSHFPSHCKKCLPARSLRLKRVKVTFFSPYIFTICRPAHTEKQQPMVYCRCFNRCLGKFSLIS